MFYKPVGFLYSIKPITLKRANKIEVCFSPAQFASYNASQCNTVVVDIFRATTSICTAFMNGVKELIPVAGIEAARALKAEGYLVASERDGIKLDFADFGNSPFNFTSERVAGNTIAYSTTNGTKAIEMATASHNVIIGAFINLEAIASWLVKEDRDVLIFCSGWKNRFSLEDSLFAGALTEILLATNKFETECDSAFAAKSLWMEAKKDLNKYILKAAHYHRLKAMGLDDAIPYCLSLNLTDIIPVLDGGRLVRINE